MKDLYKLGIFLLGLSLVTSCTHYEPLDFQVEKPESIVLQEELNSYGSLKSYLGEDASDFVLGAAVSIPEYNSKGIMYRLINSNFEEVTPGYGMKHGAIVNNDGTLNLVNLNEFLELAEAAGTSVFGHTLAWHANQNAAYLNGLLEPLVIESPAFQNDLDITGLIDGTFSGYNFNVGEEAIEIAENEGMGDGSNAIKLTAPSNAAEPFDLQFTTPPIQVVEGHEYEVIFYIKSDALGEGRISFEGLNNNTPLIDYQGSGSPSETFQTGFSWEEVRFRVSDFENGFFSINFDLGYQPGVTYYIDINNFYVYDTQGEPILNNLVVNGDFENGTGWGGWGNGSTRGVTEDGLGFGNAGRAFYVTNPTLTDYYLAQSAYDFAEPLENGETYTLSFWVKGDAEGIIRPELQSADYSADGFGQITVNQEWKRVEVVTTVTADDRGRLLFSFGEFAGTVYIDNVSLSSASGGGGSTTILEREDAVKQAIIEGELERWISEMMAAASYVDAWDVVNEPMDDGNPYELKTGIGKTDLAEDEFYWQDYLGKDYAVTAFKLAERYGNPDDLLFINDYNLEYNLDKCKGLIEYVEYIEEQGARVDGIGTQMHINIDSDRAKITEMFQLLAATGKMVKVSELDIGVGVKTTEANEELYLAQEEMYKFVMDQYFSLIPEPQQYGITIWSPTDSPASSSWRVGEPIGLWTEGFTRKPSYRGVVEGLGGIDIN